MNRILRSLIWSSDVERQPHTDNYKHVHLERLLHLSTQERSALEFVLDFYQRQGECPQDQSLFDHFEGLNDPAGLALYDELKGEQAYQGGSFHDLFEAEVESQAAANFVAKTKLAQKIATTGAKVGKDDVKGTNEAVNFLFSELRPVPKVNDDAIPADLRDAAKGLMDLYQHRKANPTGSYGIMTGYGIFDSAWHGLKKKQFTLLGGFGGHLKSTLMLNMILNGAVDGGWNQALASSEMPADELKLMLVAMHSANPMFSGQGRPLSSLRLLLGSLSSEEEAFFKLVMDDLTSNPAYGSIRIIDSGEFSTFGSVIQWVTRIHADDEVDSLWVDYLTRLPLDLKYRGMDIISGRNELLRDAKRFSMSFNQGAGLPVNSPFQINREGYKKAKANEGRYDKTSFAQYNAAEQEADNMAYIFFDSDEAATSEPKVGLAKARWAAMKYDPENVFIEPDSRRIFDLTAGMNVATGHAPMSSVTGGMEEVTL